MRNFFLICVLGLFCVLTGCQTTQPPAPESEAEPEAPEAPVEAPVEPEPEEPQPEKPPIAPEPPPKKLSLLEKQAFPFGATVQKGEAEKEWQIVKGDKVWQLFEESRKSYFDGILVYLANPLEKAKGQYRLSEIDASRYMQNFLADEADVLRSNVIVIDPGHGGKENGTTNSELGLLEKELTLEVSNRVKEHLEEKGYKVSLTRYDDRHVPLATRPELANRSKAGLFVSIHFNGSENAKAHGLESFALTAEGVPSTGDSVITDNGDVYSGNQFDQLNAKLAYTLQKALVTDLQREDRGLRQARFAVLKSLECPGALVECGFLTNPEEAFLVRTPVYREKLALAISSAIGSFMEENGQGVNSASAGGGSQ